MQRRGGWKSAKSVMRYEKSARLGAAFQELPLRPLRVVRRTSRGCRPGPAASRAPSMMPKHRRRYFLGAGGVSRRWRTCATLLQLFSRKGSRRCHPNQSDSVGSGRSPYCRTAETCRRECSTFRGAWKTPSQASFGFCPRCIACFVCPMCVLSRSTSANTDLRGVKEPSLFSATLTGRTHFAYVIADVQRPQVGAPGLGRHARLSGRAPDGRPRTAVALPYAALLCADLSFVLSSPYLTTDPTTLWFTS